MSQNLNLHGERVRIIERRVEHGNYKPFEFHKHAVTHWFESKAEVDKSHFERKLQQMVEDLWLMYERNGLRMHKLEMQCYMSGAVEEVKQWIQMCELKGEEWERMSEWEREALPIAQRNMRVYEACVEKFRSDDEYAKVKWYLEPLPEGVSVQQARDSLSAYKGSRLTS